MRFGRIVVVVGSCGLGEEGEGEMYTLRDCKRVNGELPGQGFVTLIRLNGEYGDISQGDSPWEKSKREFERRRRATDDAQPML